MGDRCPAKQEDRKFEEVIRLLYLKYHIIAMLEPTDRPQREGDELMSIDCRMMKGMLGAFDPLPGCIFGADRDFDAEYNFRGVYKLVMLPIIKQRLALKGPRGEATQGCIRGAGRQTSSTNRLTSGGE